MSHTPSKIQSDRRDFVKSTAALGMGCWLAGGLQPKKKYDSKLDKVRFACIGVQGKGSSDMADAQRTGEVVGICDIDEERLNKASASAPGAKKYFDFRKMLEEMEGSIDAVTVSTPDHTHAVAGLMAMYMGKHCFCQKPLTHSIEEARAMSEVAREKELQTQMGNQGTALSTLRQSATAIRNGCIGDVKEVHVWTNRPVWPQGDEKLRAEEIPAAVKWDLWLGPRPERDFSSAIHPFKWRGLWDFGTGALGDMACHTLNMSYMALDIRNPTSVKAETAGHNGEFFPKWSVIEFEFPELNGRPAFKMFWYDGTKKPMDLMGDLPRQPQQDQDPEDWPHYESAALLVGEKGKFYSPGDYGGEQRTSGTVIDGEFTPLRRIDWVDTEFERSPGHFDELTMAIKGDRATAPTSNFPDYAGPLTETILLGNLAVWAAGSKVGWDADKMEFDADVPDDVRMQLEKIVRHDYLNGYSIKELAAH